jgi:hypothetical protein
MLHWGLKTLDELDAAEAADKRKEEKEQESALLLEQQSAPAPPTTNNPFVDLLSFFGVASRVDLGLSPSF